MTKGQSTLIIILLAAIVAGLAVLLWPRSAPPVRRETPASSDQREAVAVSDEQLDYSLAQMRGLVASLYDLNAAEAVDDRAAMARAAVAQGPGAGRNAPAGLHEAHPAGFRDLSRTMRWSFAAMGDAAVADDMPAYYQAKRAALGACISCHESYRLERR